MIISEKTMFVIPGFFPGLSANLNVNSPKISDLLEKGYEQRTICKAFREIFSNIPSEFISKQILQERKWWQFYKRKFRTEYEDKNLQFKMRVLRFINTGEPLNTKDIKELETMYRSLSPDTKNIIPFSFFAKEKI